jgi:PhzF family phenazine biosynthesis protein
MPSQIGHLLEILRELFSVRMDLPIGRCRQSLVNLTIRRQAFVMEADADDHEVRIRFFTPTVEVPSCGHATIAAHYVRARRLGLPRCRIWQTIKAGRLPVDVDLRNGDYFIVMTQATPQVSDPDRGELRDAVVEALGLGPDQIVPDLPIQRIDTGNSKVLIPVCSRSVLDKMTPNLSALVDIHRRVPNGGYFVFTLLNPDSGILAHSRMFAPNIGIAEDPVTGNGHGPRGVYLVITVSWEAQAVIFISRAGREKRWVEQGQSRCGSRYATHATRHTNRREGRRCLRNANERFQRVFEVPDVSAKGQRLSDIVHPEMSLLRLAFTL